MEKQYLDILEANVKCFGLLLGCMQFGGIMECYVNEGLITRSERRELLLDAKRFLENVAMDVYLLEEKEE